MELSLDHKLHLRRLAYVAGFFLTISTSIAAYINSSFLEQFLSEKSVGIAYAAASLFSIIFSFNASGLIKRIGNRRAIIALTLIDLVVLAGVIGFHRSPLAIVFVSAYTILTFLLSINLDLYVESLSDDRITGRIRGIFLTVTNLAWFLSPFLAGQLIKNYDYAAIYLVASLALLPFIYIVLRWLRETIPVNREHFSLWQTLKKLHLDRQPNTVNLRRIIYLDFLLNFFYAVMVIYMPIYLLNHIGLTWDKIGLVFTFMLLPFVLLDFILGFLADRFWGEKEIMLVGIAIAGLATLAITLINSPVVWLWALALSLTRVGAASWEIMKETYLFKKIDGSDVNVLFVSRNTYPLSYIVAPILVSLFLSFAPYNFLWAALGTIVLAGLVIGLRLRDTK